MQPDIVVVGSLNMDLIVRIDRRPAKGETLLGTDFLMSPGGKGANQAYAAGKLGASVAMIGHVGDDLFADQLVGNLRAVGVETRCIDKLQGQASGIAMITIDAEGENSIIVAPGANRLLTPAAVRKYESVIRNAKLLMVQLEIPPEAVAEAVSIARAHRVPVLLDPAPARPLEDELLGQIDYLVPNENEIGQLTGIKVTNAETARQAAAVLLERGVRTVLAKRGESGVVVVSRERTFEVPGYKVETVDTTAAGDAFAGALATALAGGKELEDAVRFANAVGALTVTRPGAQNAMPTLAETETFIRGYH